MTKTIAKKELYRNLKVISDDVMQNGTAYTVLQNSKPTFYIIPLGKNEDKQYQKQDIGKFIIALLSILYF